MENTPDQSSKFRTKHWVGINDDLGLKYNTNSEIKLNCNV